MMHWDLECDVLLLGGGVGSMSAAITLNESGLKPLIIEKSDLVGGATAFSGGIVWAPNNFRMKAKAIADSRDEALTYLESVSCGRGDKAIARAYIDAVPRIVDSLRQRTALRWVTYPGLPDYYAENPGGKVVGRYLLPHGDLVGEALRAAAARWPAMNLVRPSIHLGLRRLQWVWGRALVGCLWARVLDDGTPFLLNHRAVSLVSHAGRVEGAVVSGDRGTCAIRARLGVILNTGGFEWNEEMTRRHVPGAPLHPQTPPSNEGDGHLLAAEAGAAFALMDQSIGMPSIRVPGELNGELQLHRILFQELARPHSIVVNAGGRRFANETYFPEIARAWNIRGDRCTYVNIPCFLVFDSNYVAKYGMPGGLPPDEPIHQSERLESLAATIGIDPGGLKAEVSTYNEQIGGGGADAFGRGSTAYQRVFGDNDAIGNPTVGMLVRPPYYALEIHPATSGHRGGVVIDGRARILDIRGNIIKGLFACGSCAAGTLTGETYFTGTAVGHAIVFGTLAAEEIVKRSNA
ncbi:Succinate dehydrogenase/fumarate reductase, flavoprotein subunit [Rhizobiales bacterium GAS113]|nr:Succinate dehydrogenase/fumarate reductase, flavoprotein subunit [Rhizobiales bacterium GAS113]